MKEILDKIGVQSKKSKLTNGPFIIIIRNSMDLFDEIRDKLNVKKLTKLPGTTGGGCINTGSAYKLDDDAESIVFIKECTKENSIEILAGEFASLEAIDKTGCIKVPKPKVVISDPQNDKKTVLVMEYLQMESLSRSGQKELGEKLARLHQHNLHLKEQDDKKKGFIGKYDNNQEEEYVKKFGFDATTCCGSIAQNNEWHHDWISFYSRNRLELQVQMLLESNGDRELNDLWSQLQVIIPKFFVYFDEEPKNRIFPSLLHGDLWSGNAAQLKDDGPVVFDPASFYGHSEFDLAITEMFGGFNRSFYDTYFVQIKKTPGWDKRLQLYQLFHYLNHWNHFGSGYRKQSIQILKSLCKK